MNLSFIKALMCTFPGVAYALENRELVSGIIIAGYICQLNLFRTEA